MKDIAIIGAGGFGREVQMLIEQINNKTQKYNFIGFFDDAYKKGEIVNGFPILGGIIEINKIKTNLNVVLAIGDPNTKRAIISKIKTNYISYPTLINPNVEIGNDKYIRIGKGCIITSGVIITTNITIGNHVILNLSCTVGHDSVIDDFCSFMPSVNISGDVIIAKNVYIGTGATIINKIYIGENSTIGAGTVVIKDIPDGATVVGNPGRIIKIKPTN